MAETMKMTMVLDDGDQDQRLHVGAADPLLLGEDDGDDGGGRTGDDCSEDDGLQGIQAQCRGTDVTSGQHYRHLDHDDHGGEGTHLAKFLQVQLHSDAEHHQDQTQVGQELDDLLGLGGFPSPVVAEDDTAHDVTDGGGHLETLENYGADASQQEKHCHVDK